MKKLTFEDIDKAVDMFPNRSIRFNLRGTQTLRDLKLRQYLAYHYTDNSLTDIAWYYGKRKSHGTVLHSHKSISNLIDTDKEFKSLVTNIVNSLRYSCESMTSKQLEDFCSNGNNYDLYRNQFNEHKYFYKKYK